MRTPVRAVCGTLADAPAHWAWPSPGAWAEAMRMREKALTARVGLALRCTSAGIRWSAIM